MPTVIVASIAGRDFPSPASHRPNGSSFRPCSLVAFPRLTVPRCSLFNTAPVVQVVRKHTKEISALKDHLAKHQLKLTRQREQILDVFLKNEHITAEQMYRQLAKKDPHIGLATIYRTLNLFCEAGLAQARHFGTQTQYDNVTHKGHHDHLICTSCGKIVEFENCDIERLQEEVARRNGFTITTHKLELYGLCAGCRH